MGPRGYFECVRFSVVWGWLVWFYPWGGRFFVVFGELARSRKPHGGSEGDYVVREGHAASTILMARCQILNVNKGNPVHMLH
jgi:hypothetical protein